MKRYILFLPILFILTSCGVSQKVLSPTEIKMMTTKQFEANYDLVFSSAISLLQSEGFSLHLELYSKFPLCANFGKEPTTL